MSASSPLISRLSCRALCLYFYSWRFWFVTASMRAAHPVPNCCCLRYALRCRASARYGLRRLRLSFCGRTTGAYVRFVCGRTGTAEKTGGRRIALARYRGRVVAWVSLPPAIPAFSPCLLAAAVMCARNKRGRKKPASILPWRRTRSTFRGTLSIPGRPYYSVRAGGGNAATPGRGCGAIKDFDCGVGCLRCAHGLGLLLLSSSCQGLNVHFLL